MNLRSPAGRLENALRLGPADVVLAFNPINSSAGYVSGSLIFDDEFGGAKGNLASSLRWTYDTGTWTGELQTYVKGATAAGIDGQGHLNIVARKSGRGYSSGRITTRGRFSVKYGRIVARMKLPAAKAGIFPAFWMLNSENYPSRGEIDLLERANTSTTAYGVVHGRKTNGAHWRLYRYKHPAVSLATSYHTYETRWSPSSISWYIDGVKYGTITRAQMPSGGIWGFNTYPEYLTLNVAVGGWGGTPKSSSFPSTLSVDYVRVYAY
jgi:beta-glucanase (GH16 family)